MSCAVSKGPLLSSVAPRSSSGSAECLHSSLLSSMVLSMKSLCVLLPSDLLEFNLRMLSMVKFKERGLQASWLLLMVGRLGLRSGWGCWT